MLSRIALALIITLPVFGQPPTHHGPFDVYSANDLIVGRDGRTFLSTTGGAYYSDDQGDSWQPIEHYMNSIYFHPGFTIDSKTDRLYAWDRAQGIFFTDDNGETWDIKLIGQSPEGGMLMDLAVYGDSIFLGTEKGLKMVIGGTFFPEPVSFFNDKEITSVFLRGNELFCGTKSSGFYFSDDGGLSWEGRSNGLPAGFVVNGIVASGNITFVYSSFDGVYYSTDKGLTWQPKNTGLGSLQISDLLVDDEQIYVSTFGYNNVYSSTLSGAEWNKLDGTFPTQMAVESIAIVNGVFIGCGHGSVIKSVDHGNEWVESYNGISDVFVIKTIEQSPDGVLWATGTHTGVYRMEPGETHFSHFDTDGTNYGSPRLVADSLVVINYQKLRFYDTGEESWKDDIDFSGIHFPDRIVKSAGGLFMSTHNQGVFKYVGGTSWEPINSGLNSLNTTDFIYSNGIFFLATDDGFYTRADADTDWTKVDFDEGSPGVTSFLVKDDFIIIFTSDYKCYKSTDAGGHWNLVNGIPPGAAMFTMHGSRLFAANFETVFISDNLGDTWFSGPHSYGGVTALAVYNDLLYTATWERGIWSSTLKLNQNLTFGSLSTDVNVHDVLPISVASSSGLPVTVNVVSGSASIVDNMLHINESGDIRLVAWQGGNEIFNEASVEVTLRASEITAVEDVNRSIVTVYPNPTSTMLKIAVDGDVRNGSADLINSNGERVVAQIRFEEEDNFLDVATLPRGMYILIYRHSNRVSMTRVILK